MIDYFPKAKEYLNNINISSADKLDVKAKELIENADLYERASQALRRRFVRGAEVVEAVDRGGRKTKIKRDKDGGKYNYLILGSDGNWSEPTERIWVVSMYALWQSS